MFTHGLGGSLAAQPEIEEVFAPRGHTIHRIVVPHHENPLATAAWIVSATFGGLCRVIHQTAERILRTAADFAPEPYALIGDSLGGFASVVAAERDVRISHCVLLSCSGELCDAVSSLDALGGLGDLAGMLSPLGRSGFRGEAAKAIAGESIFQKDFDLVNPSRAERKIPRLMMLCDRHDPVMPAEACLRFAAARATRAYVFFPYDESRHHPIGADALERFAVPFLENGPLPEETLRFADGNRLEGASDPCYAQEIERDPRETLNGDRVAEGSPTMHTRLFFGTVQPGKAEEAVRMLAEFAKRVKEQKGCVLGQVLHCRDEVIGITSWRTEEDLAAYADSDLARELFGRITPLLLGMPKVQSYEVKAFEKGADA